MQIKNCLLLFKKKVIIFFFIKKCWQDQGLNPRPFDYEKHTLPTELLRQDENLALLVNPYKN